MHFALTASNKKQVEDFYKLALEIGGTDNGKPGIREDYGENYFACFVYDPEGNNIEVVCRENN